MTREPVRHPWSKSQLNKLTVAIRDRTEAAPDVPTYNEVITWYDDLAARVQREIRQLDFEPLLPGVNIEISSRAKTIDTLRDKLIMGQPSMTLATVQDVAGVRFEAEMSTDEQDGVVNAIIGLFDHGQDAVRDLREASHSGYRAVHIWLRLPARVEVQVRTHLQGQWANVYESMADALGREIRYGQLPEDPDDQEMVRAVQAISVETIKATEMVRCEMANARMLLDEYRAEASPGLGLVQRFSNQRRLNRVERRMHALAKNHIDFEKAVSSQLRAVKQGYDQQSHIGR